MTFNSYIYMLVFLPFVIIGFFTIGHFSIKASTVFLIVASFLFVFYQLNWKGLLVLAISLAFNYCVFQLLRRNSDRHRKAILIIGITVNAIALLAFKYAVFGANLIIDHFQTEIETSKFFLPIGISFYTFTEISFLIDTYRNEVPKCSLLDYLSYITFFPKFLSGPIMLQDQFLPQLYDESRRHFSWKNFSKGLYRFALGLGKKVLIADTFAQAADLIYGNIDAYYNINICIAVISYSFQLYFDFSGYCDMAIGSAKMLNFDLPENFLSPYKSMNIHEFWERWHITLTKFLTKYVYFPLGGSRKGKVRTYINILIVFLVSGLWHGSTALRAYVVWGLIHGMVSVCYRLFHKGIDRLHPVVNWMITFSIVSLAWVPFRVQDMTATHNVWARLLMWREPQAVPYDIAMCFKLKEITFLEEVAGFAPLANDPWVYPIAFICISMMFVLCADNTSVIAARFKPTPIRAVITVLLLGWCVMYFANVGTFIYAGF